MFSKVTNTGYVFVLGYSALCKQLGKGVKGYFQVKKQFNVMKLNPTTKSGTFLLLVI